MDRVTRISSLNNLLALACDADAQRVFADVVCVRADGYSEYRNLVPFDSLDFVSTHHVLYAGDTPVAAFRHVPLGTCLRYALTFPILDAIERRPSAKLAAQHVRSLVDAHQKKPDALAASGRFTIRREFRHSPQLANDVWEIVAALVQSDMDAMSIDLELGLSLDRPRVIDRFRRMGYRPSARDGVPLDPVEVKAGDGRQAVVLLEWHGRSSSATECQQRHAQLLNRREIHGGFSR